MFYKNPHQTSLEEHHSSFVAILAWPVKVLEFQVFWAEAALAEYGDLSQELGLAGHCQWQKPFAAQLMSLRR